MTKLYLALLLGLALLNGCDGCQKTAPSPFSFSPAAKNAAALDWQPWSTQAAVQASTEKKPIVISVNDPLCYWCDILDRTTLSNDRVVELLQNKFVLVRVEKERQPHVAAHLENGLPTIAALQPDGNQVWQGGYLQPSAFNQKLYQVLRDEMLVIKRAGQRRYEPTRAIPADDFVRNYFLELSSNFEYAKKGYPGDQRNLALESMRFEIKTGPAVAGTVSQMRLNMHLDSVMKYFRDPAGGFVTGSFNANWDALNPVKFAHEQAEIAAVIMRLSRSPWAAASKELPSYMAAAEEAVAWLEKHLWVAGTLLPGELGTPEAFRTGKRPPAAPTLPKARTDAGGATASALAEAGRLGGREDWIRLAEKIAGAFFAARTPEKLFWHLPQERAVANELGDAAAMLDAAVSLYEATGAERWLMEAREIAFALEQLSAPEGYFVDTTTSADAIFPAQPLPGPNLRAASALWRLGNLTADEAFRGRARLIVMAFAGSTHLLESSRGDYAVLVYQMTGPTGRLSVPAAWRTLPEAADLVRHPSPRVYVRFTEDSVAQLCEDSACTATLAEPAAAEKALVSYLATLTIPR